MDDLFLKIIAGEIPSAKLYEDDLTYAFLDIRPTNKGHALVVPKEKYRNALDTPPETFAAMAKTAQKIAVALKEAVGADGVNIAMNNEAAAHQEVFHAHIHVIPRFEGDGIFKEPKRKEYEDGEIDTVAETIRQNLS